MSGGAGLDLLLCFLQLALSALGDENVKLEKDLELSPTSAPWSAVAGVGLGAACSSLDNCDPDFNVHPVRTI